MTYGVIEAGDLGSVQRRLWSAWPWPAWQAAHLPFLYSLYFQQERGLSPFMTGVAFLPVMLIGLLLTPISARIVERLGVRLPVVGGLVLMTVGLLSLALMPATAPLWLLSTLMVLIGLGGPLVMPPIMAVLLNGVPAHQAGTASGVFNTSRQIGGALAVAVFGTLLAHQASFINSLRTSLAIAAGVALVAALCALSLRPSLRRRGAA